MFLSSSLKESGFSLILERDLDPGRIPLIFSDQEDFASLVHPFIQELCDEG